LRAQRSILREDVPVVREVLGMWQRQDGTDLLDDQLRELRAKLASLNSAR
jgi:hypothetical protein